MDSFLSLRADLHNAARLPNDENVNAAPRNATMEPSPQCLPVRYAPKRKLILQAMAIMMINLKSVKSAGDYAPDVRISRAKYDRAILTRAQSIVSPESYRAFDDAMGRVSTQCQLHCERRIVGFSGHRSFARRQ